MKEYKAVVVDAFHSDLTLDRKLKEMTDQGYTIIPVTFRGNVMIFEREATNSEKRMSLADMAKEVTEREKLNKQLAKIEVLGGTEKGDE